MQPAPKPWNPNPCYLMVTLATLRALTLCRSDGFARAGFISGGGSGGGGSAASLLNSTEGRPPSSEGLANPAAARAVSLTGCMTANRSRVSCCCNACVGQQPLGARVLLPGSACACASAACSLQMKGSL